MFPSVHAVGIFREYYFSRRCEERAVRLCETADSRNTKATKQLAREQLFGYEGVRVPDYAHNALNRFAPPNETLGTHMNERNGVSLLNTHPLSSSGGNFRVRQYAAAWSAAKLSRATIGRGTHGQR